MLSFINKRCTCTYLQVYIYIYGYSQTISRTKQIQCKEQHSYQKNPQNKTCIVASLANLEHKYNFGDSSKVNITFAVIVFNTIYFVSFRYKCILFEDEFYGKKAVDSLWKSDWNGTRCGREADKGS